jgi:hypothetical protein
MRCADVSKSKHDGTAPKGLVAHSFAEESVTEGSGGERDSMVAIDAIGVSNPKSMADLRIESSSELARVNPRVV